MKQAALHAAVHLEDAASRWGLRMLVLRHTGGLTGNGTPGLLPAFTEQGGRTAGFLSRAFCGRKKPECPRFNML